MRRLAIKQAQLIKQFSEPYCRRHIETVFLYFAAPVLRGAKPAALLTLQPYCLPAWRERQNALRKATGLQTQEITNRQGAILLLLYDEAAMHTLLGDPHTTALLDQYGYPAGGDPQEMLSYLQSRFADAVFPHEIGLFLGYPVEDVWGFIANEGRNCICSRHWKVYHNAEKAHEMFRRIDEAHSCALELLYRPIPVHVKANLLKAV